MDIDFKIKPFPKEQVTSTLQENNFDQISIQERIWSYYGKCKDKKGKIFFFKYSRAKTISKRLEHEVQVYNCIQSQISKKISFIFQKF